MLRSSQAPQNVSHSAFGDVGDDGDAESSRKSQTLDYCVQLPRPRRFCAEILEQLHENKIHVDERTMHCDTTTPSVPNFTLKAGVRLRPYQAESTQRFFRNGSPIMV